MSSSGAPGLFLHVPLVLEEAATGWHLLVFFSSLSPFPIVDDDIQALGEGLLLLGELQEREVEEGTAHIGHLLLLFLYSGGAAGASGEGQEEASCLLFSSCCQVPFTPPHYDGDVTLDGDVTTVVVELDLGHDGHNNDDVVVVVVEVHLGHEGHLHLYIKSEHDDVVIKF